MNYLGLLSTELVSLIVHFVNRRDLYACALINQQFHAVSTPLLWRTLHDKNIGTFIRVITDATRSEGDGDGDVGQYIRHGNFNDLDNATFLLIINHLPHLETLAIDSARFITDTSLQQLPYHCPHLTWLHLRRTPKITYFTMVALGQHCPQLRTLDLDKCSHLGSDIFSSLPAFRRLEELSIQGRYKMMTMNDDNTWMDNNSTILNVIGLHGLTRLTLFGIPAHFTKRLLTTTTTTTATLEHATYWPHLMHLCLSYCNTLNETEVITFIKTHPHLVSLELHLADLSDTTLDAVAHYLPDIMEVGLGHWYRITPAGIRQLVCKCRSLTRVYFGQWWSDMVTEAFPEANGYCFLDLRDRRKLFQLDHDTINRIRLGSTTTTTGNGNGNDNDD